MSKKSYRIQAKRVMPLQRHRKIVLAVGLLLIFSATGVAVAHWAGIWHAEQQGGEKQNAGVMPMAFTPSSPAKEFVYAGGRIVATEEPAASGSTPFINSVAPQSANQNSSISISISGSNLSGASSINFNPSASITVSNINSSSGGVTANISVAASAQIGGRNLSVTTPNGTSNSLTFTINAQAANPAPTLNEIFPTSVSAGGGDFTLILFGSQFIDTSEVRIDSSPRPVTFRSANELRATISGSDRTPGQKRITVFNPGPGGGTSAERTLTVTSVPGTPSITSISPDRVTAGGASFTLTVNGTNFASNSVVRINESDRTTSFISAGVLTAQIQDFDITTEGPRNIRVFTPTTSGGILSNIVVLTVTPAGGGSGTGLTGEYFNNKDHAGTPVITRTDPTVDFSWGGGSPHPSINIDQFSVRWSGQVQPQFNEAYTFYVFSDDGVRVWINGRKIIDKWYDQYGPEHTSSPILLTGGQKYDIRVEYYENWAGAEIHLKWSSLQTPKQAIPSARLFPTTTGAGLKGEYFNGMQPVGTPAMTRTDLAVDFIWDGGSPGAPIFNDQFSVRWTGRVQAQFTGLHRFYVLTDDGVRLWVNNVLLVDKWFDQYGQEWNNTINLVAGQMYDIRMEYYENCCGAEAHLSWSYGTAPKHIIPPTNLFLPSSGAPPLYEGVHEIADCTKISGWAANRNQPNVPINVDIYNGASLLATVPANIHRPELVQILGDNGNHGFSFDVPPSLRDGLPHSISVRFPGTSTNLTNSPRTITCAGSAPPAAPSGLVATVASASQINLTWFDLSNNENGFSIERKAGVEGQYAEIGTTNANVTSFSDTGRSPSITYYYKVRAFNGAGYSGYSNEANATITGGPTPPAAPDNLAALTISSSSIRLTWTDRSNNETGFKIERRRLGGVFTQIREVTAGTQIFLDTGLARLTTYSYRIRAYNAAGDSAYTATVSATTSGGTPPPCGLVSAFSGDGSSGSSYGYAEGIGSAAKWRSPSAGTIGIDPVSGMNALFVADTENHRIRMVYIEGPAAGQSILIAGSGVAGYSNGDGDPYEARYNSPQGIEAIKGQNGLIEALLVADSYNNEIRMLLPPLGGTSWRPVYFSGKLSPGYSDGSPGQTLYSTPLGITVGPDGFIYVADTYNFAVRRVDREGNSSTLYKSPSHIGAMNPVGIVATDMSEGVYVTDINNHAILKVTGGAIEVVAGSGGAGYANGVYTQASFNSPYHIAWAPWEGQGVLYVSDLNNNRVRKVELPTKTVSLHTGTGAPGYINAVCLGAEFNSPSGIAVSPAGDIYVIEVGNNSIRKIQ
ncbi:MAG TPA: PA14 domain-containing protein [Blastocatellia bacterium]|nr:PA14 domain-containing protein [Blastocatellia bacterium]